MKTSKIALAAAAFGAVAAFAPAQAGEVNYNFSSELANQEAAIAADGRVEGGQRGFTPSAVSGPEVGKRTVGFTGDNIKQAFENLGNWWNDRFGPNRHIATWEEIEPFVNAHRYRDLSYLPGGSRYGNNSSQINDRQLRRPPPGGSRYQHNSFRPR